MTVKIGIIGCGVIGPKHMTALRKVDGAEIVAVADVDGQRANEAAEKFGVEKVYTDPIELLDNPEIQGVVMALPAGLRASLSIEALRRGKHIMVEKPAARNLAEFDAMAAAAAESGCMVACASARYMLMPHSAPVREFILSGALGAIRSIHFRNLLPPGPPPTAPPPAWRVSKQLNGGGALVNWSSYELDYIFGITGWRLKPRHVSAKWWPIPPQFKEYVAPDSDADEHFAAFISCDDNIAVYLERGERVADEPEESMRIVGTSGSVKLSMYPQEGDKRILFFGFEGGANEQIIWQGHESWAETDSGIAGDFVDAIANGRQPQTNIERGRVLQQIIDAVYLSNDENRPVEIL